jgi:hypothetical protein
MFGLPPVKRERKLARTYPSFGTTTSTDELVECTREYDVGKPLQNPMQAMNAFGSYSLETSGLVSGPKFLLCHVSVETWFWILAL